MNSRKWRNLAIVTFLGLFFLTHSLVFIWLLVGALVIMHPSGNEKRQLREADYRRDAEGHGVKIPPTDDVHFLLAQVYDRYRQSKNIHPQLSTQYDDILEELWGGLKLEAEEDGWVLLLRKVLADWPISKNCVHANLQKKLRRVQAMSDQWQEAVDEVYGEA